MIYIEQLLKKLEEGPKENLSFFIREKELENITEKISKFKYQLTPFEGGYNCIIFGGEKYA